MTASPLSQQLPPVRPHVLREYALLADGERGAIIGPDGELAWMCVPNWDSDAVFAALLGGGGFYQVCPDDGWFVWGGSYEPGTLIWHSRWRTSEATVECREALAFPGDHRRAIVLRRIRAVRGSVRVRMRLSARGDFGRVRPGQVALSDGIWTMRAGAHRLRWSGAGQARETADALCATTELTTGQNHDLILELSDRQLPDQLPDPDVLWPETEEAWRRAVPGFADTIAPGDAAHSYAVLRGMTSHTGGLVAAATTSLPERSDAGRDYDYRFTWIRDQCYVGQGIAAHGPHPLLDDAVRFVSARLLENGPRLRPAYTVTGKQLPDEHQLSLPGYPGGVDHIGNKARRQFQLDVFGEALLLLAAASRWGRLDAESWRAAEIAVDAISRHWRAPDAGVWELDDHRWTHSGLICAAGLRAMAQTGDRAATGAEWIALADRITAETTATSLHPSGRWQRAKDDPGVDAALLLPAIRGAIPADDPRSTATLAAVRKELSTDAYVYRFRHDQRPLADAEGAFLICGFHTALAEQQAGDEVAALRRFERNRAACGPPGLYTEEYDVVQRQLRGNLPQAFVHGALIEAATRLTASRGG
ncbi:glycoside hydrolase family 15 protein [Sciscionella sediminilitoris]|uniref:glycoside hydrolase family 15 protein n=1 Tax=Sciscionella sediminilitoris TaxID=1445613 RepID=UPI0004DF0603|nr:glycoside hydrolase family 15 protein [Sciscionella sp. SE31]